jgi:hypothetical protein
MPNIFNALRKLPKYIEVKIIMNTLLNTFNTACVAMFVLIKTINDIKLYVVYAIPLQIYKKYNIDELILPTLSIISSSLLLKNIGKSYTHVKGSATKTPVNEICEKRLISFIRPGCDRISTFERTALAEKNTFDPIANINPIKLKASDVMHEVATPMHIGIKVMYVFNDRNSE